MTPRVVAKLDPYWHRMNLTVSADATAGHANAVRDALAADLPVDVTVRLDEAEARALSADSLTAARSMFGRWNTGRAAA